MEAMVLQFGQILLAAAAVEDLTLTALGQGEPAAEETALAEDLMVLRPQLTPAAVVVVVGVAAHMAALAVQDL